MHCTMTSRKYFDQPKMDVLDEDEIDVISGKIIVYKNKNSL